jgi:hypothetical protein
MHGMQPRPRDDQCMACSPAALCRRPHAAGSTKPRVVLQTDATVHDLGPIQKKSMQCHRVAVSLCIRNYCHSCTRDLRQRELTKQTKLARQQPLRALETRRLHDGWRVVSPVDPAR